MTNKKHTTHVSELKKKRLSELEKLAGSKRTILISSIKNIPGSQFQEISKRLRGKAVVKVPKKNIVFRALDSLEGPEKDVVEKLKEKIGESTAILFSDIDAFELAAELISKKTPAKAKPGQEAPFDIEIPAGPTELVPGPAISELGALGIQIQIDKGKISIKAPKVIAKKGDEISQAAADMMSKLDIRPFTIGFIPLAAFDNKEGKIYLDIQIDTEAALNDLKTAFGRALPFAVQIGYVSEDTISFFIGKAGMHGKVLEKFASSADDKKDNGKQDNVNENTGQTRSELKSDENSEPQGEANSKETQTPENKQESGEETK